jgi:hypothetical protein
LPAVELLLRRLGPGCCPTRPRGQLSLGHHADEAPSIHPFAVSSLPNRYGSRRRRDQLNRRRGLFLPNATGWRTTSRATLLTPGVAPGGRHSFFGPVSSVVRVPVDSTRLAYGCSKWRLMLMADRRPFYPAPGGGHNALSTRSYPRRCQNKQSHPSRAEKSIDTRRKQDRQKPASHASPMTSELDTRSRSKGFQR